MAINVILKDTVDSKEIDVIDIPINSTFTGILYNRISNYEQNYSLFINTFDRLICFFTDGSFKTYISSEKIQRNHLFIRNYKLVDLDIIVK